MSEFEKCLQLVLQAAPVPMAVNDDAQCITHLNPAFVRTFGYTHAEIPTLQDWWNQAYPDPDYRRWVIGAWGQRLQASRREGRPFEAMEVQIRARDGSTRTVLAEASALGATLHGSHLVTLYDITERKQTEDRLRLSEERYRMLADNVSDVIWVLDLKTRQLEYVSPSIEQLRGYTPAEVLALPFGHGLTPESARLVAARFQEVEARIRAGDHSTLVHRTEVDQVHRDGRIVHTEVLARCLLDAQGEPVALLGVTRDTSERQRSLLQMERQRQQLEDKVAERTQQLSEAKEAAEAASLAKSAFLANMSHELRTPLNAITGLAYLLKQSGMTPLQLDRLDKIIDAGSHLVETINAVLKLSRIEAGKLELADAPLDPLQTLAAVQAMVAEQAAAKGLLLVSDPQALDIPLRGDPTRLQQALLNYAANAVKFTHSGTVTLRMRVQAQDGDGLLLRFEVEDSGIGIAPQVLPRLFMAFHQADSSLTRQYGGSGLGLAITQRLARLMGGEAGASSTPGQGSLFWFTARLRRDTRAAQSGAGPAGYSPAAELAQRCSGRLILLAEDEPLNREVVVAMLSALDVDVAVDGQQAVDMAARRAYGLVLMDMQMPLLDGLEATRRIRQLPGYARVPIVALTANAFDEDRQRCLAAGMDDFLSKPVDATLLYATMLRWLTRGR